MKKVLILTVIAILALGVMALADHQDSVGATCSEATLTVTSNIVVVQGFEATATAYDATFCGATGDPLSPVSTYLTSFLSHHGLNPMTASPASGVLLEKLEVRSNAATIAVEITGSNFEFNGQPMTLSQINSFMGSIGGFSTGIGNNTGAGWYEPYPHPSTYTIILNLESPTSSIPYYSGTLYAYLAKIPAWLEAGKYSFDTAFTIMPKSDY